MSHADARFEALLSVLCERPHDEAARLACAERLVELGDERGEFIRLQCAAPRHGTNATLLREEELLGSHETGWLGPLAPAVSAAEWDGGFLFACTLPHPAPEWLRERAGDWRWATVEALEFEGWWEGGASAAQLADFVCAPRLASLRRLGGVTLPLLEELASRGAALEKLALLPLDLEHGAAATLLAMPALRRLAIELNAEADPASLEWFWGAALPERLESLEIEGIAEEQIPLWHRFIAGQPKGALQEIAFSRRDGRNGRDGWAFGFGRAPAGDWSVLRYQSFAPAASRSLRQLARAMRLLPRDTLTRLIVEPQRLRSEEIHDLEDARAHHPRLGPVETAQRRCARSTLYARAR